MKILLSALFVLTLCSSQAIARSTTHPPDSTTGIIDKSAALLLIDQGKKMVAEGKVRDALIIFREASVKDPMTWKAPFWISYCHYRLNNFGYARQYGEEAVKKGGADVDKDIYDILGSSYHQIGRLDSATIYYEKALAELPKPRAKELRVEQKLAECKFAEDAMSKATNQRVSMRGDVNSGFNEYGPILVNGGKIMYFTSRRGNTTGGKVNPDDQEYFEDIYVAEWNDATQQWDSVSNDLDRLNSAGFDAISYVSADGLKGIVTLNNTATDAKKQTRSSDICEIEFTNKGKWTAPKPIANKSINTSFFEGAATVTADGNTMYFVTDRKGEKRSTDIYVVHKVGKKWGVAQALPDSINTEGRETTPYITPDGRFLFFSSNGHAGMGGLDVYVCENTGTGWGSPINLGAGVNTVNDDTHFKLYRELEKAVMAGFNLQGQKSSMDLYEIDLSKITLPIKM